MLRASLTILLALAASVPAAEAQRRESPAGRGARPAPAANTVREQPLMQCPSILGNGLTTQRLYCDVLIGREPGSALRISIPPHQGLARLSFTLHNRQTYSESEVKAGKAFTRYTARLRLSTPDGQDLGPALIRSEFRTENDLVERVGGGAGPRGAKAVAPTGAEPIVVQVPEEVSEVLVSGEQLVVERFGGREVVTTPGHPIAVVSQVEIEYQPARAGSRR